MLKRNKDKNTPGALASELAEAKTDAEIKIAQARQDLQVVRDGVIERGTQRQAELSSLAAEIEEERAKLADVLRKA